MKRKSLLFVLLLALFMPWAANAQQSLPYVEGFEDYGSGLPTGWTKVGSGTVAVNSPIADYVHTGAKSLKFSGSTSNVVALPQFTAETNTLQISVFTRPEGTYASSKDFDIGYITDLTDASTFVALATYNYSGFPNGYLEKTVSMSSAPNGAYIAFRHRPSSTSYYWFVDDITVMVPSCPIPTITGVIPESDQVSIQWTKDGSISNWELEYSTNEDFTNATLLTINNGLPVKIIHDLTPGTTYYVRVRSNCGDGDYSDWSVPVSFVTECEAITYFPWSEDFESYNASSSGVKFEDPCWENIHLEGTGAYFFEVYSGTNGTNSTKQLRLHDMNSGTMTKLRLPQMTLTTGDSYLFSIDVYRNATGTSYTGEGIRVYASTDGEIEGATELAFISRNYGTGDGNLIPAESGTGWYTYELPIPFTGTCYIILRGESKYGAATYMDNFKVKKELPCVKPSDPTFVSATTTAATLSWTNGAEGQTAWQIAYSTDPSFNPDAVTPVDVTSNPGTINGLTAATVYYAYVRANCGDLGYSEWSATYCQFTTACEAITIFPWNDDFESYSTGDFNAPCWVNERIVDGTGSSGTLAVFKITTYSYTGNSTQLLQLPDMKAGTLTKLVLPEMTLPGNDYQFVLDVYRNTNNKPTEGIRVYVSTDGAIEGATELAFISRDYTVSDGGLIPAETASDWYTYQLPLGISGTCYIILQGESQYGSATYMDNFFVEQIPACPKPTGLAVTQNSVTAHGATITWTAGGEETEWIVEYADNANFENAMTESVEDEPTFTFQSLTAETTYYVRVKANCGGSDGVSDPSIVVNFTTTEACPAPTGLTCTAVTATTATLSWTETGDGTSWFICLNNDETNLIEAATNPYMLTNLTAETVYTAKVRSNCGTAWSNTVNFEPTDKLVIGEATGTSGNLPTNTNYDYSYTQQIYTVTELSEAGMIESIDFYMTSTSNYTRNLDIYMVSTDKSSFTGASDWIAVSEADKVFSGDVNFLAQAWTTITLDEPFLYDGTQNVAIIVDDNTDDYSSRNFRTYTASANQSHYAYQDNDDIVPSAPSASYNSVTTTKNQIRILKSPLPSCMPPMHVTVTEVTPTGATIVWDKKATQETGDITYNYTWVEYGGTPDWTLNAGMSAFDRWNNSNPPTAYAFSLESETEYDFYVRRDCGNGEYSDVVMVSFTTLEGCPVPTNLEVSDISVNSANVAWNGYNDSYTVSYRVAPTMSEPIFSEDFSNGIGNWTMVDCHGSTGIYNGAFRFRWSTTPPQYLISPEITGIDEDAIIEFTYRDDNFIETFEVGYSLTDNEIASFNFGPEVVTPKDATTYTYHGTVPAGTKYVSIKCTSNDQYYLYIDDIVIANAIVSPWTIIENATNPQALTGLTPMTDYEVKVQGFCDEDPTDESEVVTFTTAEGYIKEITGYGTGKGNWYLIASPIGTIANSDLEEKVINIFSNSYDLFYFDQAKENEWVNYKPNESGEGNTSTHSHFGIEKGKGYLYANKYDVDLVFTGSAYTTTDGRETVQLAYTAGDGVDLPGWNLVGNPFAEKAYLEGNRGFYTMDGDGNFTAVTNASIEVMEGIFVVAEGTNESVTFTTSEPTKGGNLALNLSNGRKAIDRAIVRFDGGRQLPKLQFRQGSTKVYIPVEGQDYAIVSGEEMGELPVYFKAEENGSYSLSFNAEAVSFAYLHLIDNMTGADVDLLETPSYSFEAKTTDYASRFKLVFATGSSTGSETFAFFSNGSFVINNEGEATLQVVDVMGRIVKSESINGCANVSVNGAAGVYMLRLINGDNVKVQKVVVK